MVSASAEDGLGLILCEGPVSYTVQKDEDSEHDHHHSNDEASGELHISPVCSHWSTSSLLVINTLFEPANIITIQLLQKTQYQTQLFQQDFNNNHDIRGPPFSIS
ncbi:MAG: hypothetical protein HND53_02300 [Proteobacteria bacterium]|nr:hypothetical protein [Pseudomonadota bacterium]